jgi:hypothetical protein
VRNTRREWRRCCDRKHLRTRARRYHQSIERHESALQRQTPAARRFPSTGRRRRSRGRRHPCKGGRHSLQRRRFPSAGRRRRSRGRRRPCEGGRHSFQRRRRDSNPWYRCRYGGFQIPSDVVEEASEPTLRTSRKQAKTPPVRVLGTTPSGFGETALTRQKATRGDPERRFPCEWDVNGCPGEPRSGTADSLHPSTSGQQAGFEGCPVAMAASMVAASAFRSRVLGAQVGGETLEDTV